MIYVKILLLVSHNILSPRFLPFSCSSVKVASSPRNQPFRTARIVIRSGPFFVGDIGFGEADEGGDIADNFDA